MLDMVDMKLIVHRFEPWDRIKLLGVVSVLLLALLAVLVVLS
jgi:hypothetical protein